MNKMKQVYIYDSSLLECERLQEIVIETKDLITVSIDNKLTTYPKDAVQWK